MDPEVIGCLKDVPVLINREQRVVILGTEPPIKFSIDHPYIQGTKLEREARAALDAGLPTAEDVRGILAPSAEMGKFAAENDRLRAVLRPFAEIGQWLFARPIPDETPLAHFDGINGYRQSLTRGDFKAAHLALHPRVDEQSVGDKAKELP